MIDLRSDTITKPDSGMRRAMYEAEVGDDVFAEDPTANRLQETVADLLGMEASLFVPSGTMGNQLGIKVLTQPGDEVLVERSSHVLNYESGAPGLLSGVQLNVLDGDRGVLRPEQVRSAVRFGYYWEAPTKVLCLENTVNKAGGRVYPLDALTSIVAAAREKELLLHLDGARLWNASVACGRSEKELASDFDTVTVCLSKGLGAPVGSLIAGARDHIDAAHRYRKLFGGGMRQIGILAAAGLYALEHNRSRLEQDHENARRLAQGIAEFKSFEVTPDEVDSNIVMFDTCEEDATPVLESLRSEGVLMVPFGPRTIRATTHLHITSSDIDRVLVAMRHRFN